MLVLSRKSGQRIVVPRCELAVTIIASLAKPASPEALVAALGGVVGAAAWRERHCGVRLAAARAARPGPRACWGYAPGEVP